MKTAIDLLKTSDKFFLIPIFFSLLSALMISLPLLFFYNHLPSSLPLFYSLPWGQSQLVSKDEFFILPAAILIMSFGNTFISSQLHSAQFLIKRMLTLNLILLNLAALVTALRIFSIFI